MAIDFGELGVGDLSDFQPEIRHGNWLSRDAFDRSNGEVTVHVLGSTAKRARSEDFAEYYTTLAELPPTPGLERAIEFGRSESGHDYAVFPRPSRFSIQQELVASSGLSWRTPVDAIRSAAEALIPLHEAGLSHGHIRPAVVLVGGGEDPVISEPGLSLLDDAKKFVSFGIADHDGLRYRAPEILTGQPATPQSDVYGLGITLWAYLHGRNPFTGLNLATSDLIDQVLTQHLDGFGIHVPKAIRTVVFTALSKDPADRYEDAATLLAALEAEATSHYAPVAATGAAHQPAFIPAVQSAGGLGLSLVPKVAVGALAMICALSVGAWATTRSGDSKPEEPRIQILGSTTIREATTSQPIITERPTTTRRSLDLISTTLVDDSSTTSSPATTIRSTTARPATTRPTTTLPTTTETSLETTTTTEGTTSSQVVTIKPGSTSSTTEPPTTTVPVVTTPETTEPATTVVSTTVPVTAEQTVPDFTLPDFIIEILERRSNRRGRRE